MSWLFVLLLACAVAVLIGAEWPRLSNRAGFQAHERRRRARRKSQLRVIRSESDEFAESVQRDLERLPTTRDRDRRP